MEKDTKLGSLLLKRAMHGRSAPLQYPLLTPANRFDEGVEEGDEEEGDEEGGGITLSASPVFEGMLATDMNTDTHTSGVVNPIHGTTERTGHAAQEQRRRIHDGSFCTAERLTVSEREIVTLIDDIAFSILSQDNARIMEDSRALLKDKPKLLQYAMRSDHCRKTLEPYRWSLFITIFASILQGSFISYATGCVLNGVELPTILYFVRIFADLIGRPLALLPKPYPFNHINGVLTGAIIRGLLTTFYFSVIANILYPHEYVRSTLCHVIVLVFQVNNCASLHVIFVRSIGLRHYMSYTSTPFLPHTHLLAEIKMGPCTFALQVFFSMTSGYFNCLTYDYAGKSFTDEWERVLASQYLNLTFHRACSSAVVTAITLILLVDVIKSALDLHINTTHE